MPTIQIVAAPRLCTECGSADYYDCFATCRCDFCVETELDDIMDDFDY